MFAWGKLECTMELGKRSHKLKKGETLDVVARKYGHKNPDTIWNHDKNKRVRSRRKAKESLAAGDVLYIPLNKKEAEAAQYAIAALDSLLTIELDLREALVETNIECASFAGRLEGSRIGTITALKSVESTMITVLSTVRMGKANAAILKNPKKAAKIQSDLMKAVEKDIENAMKEAERAKVLAETGKLPKPGAVKKAGSAVASGFKELNRFIKSAEADSAVTNVSDIVDGALGTAKKTFAGLSREIAQATSTRFWFDVFFFGELDLLDASAETDKQLKRLTEAINKSKRLTVAMNTGYKVLIKVYDASARSAKKELDACLKRIKSLEKQMTDYPSLIELKRL